MNFTGDHTHTEIQLFELICIFNSNFEYEELIETCCVVFQDGLMICVATDNVLQYHAIRDLM